MVRSAPERIAAELTCAGVSVIAKGLTWGTSGNISARLDDDAFVISMTGVALDELDDTRIVRCSLASVDADRDYRSSVETGMHRAVYDRRADVAAILHASPMFTTLVASSELPVEADVSTDTAVYVGSVVRVPFRYPGSDELAAFAADAAERANAILLENHGCICLADTPREVVQRAEALERLCSMLVAEALGFPLRRLPADAFRRLSARRRESDRTV
jgi:L-fuculose-phosphate aldolase